MAKRNSNKKAAQFNMEVGADLALNNIDDDALLSALLEEAGAADAAPVVDEVIEDVEEAAAPVVESTIEAADASADDVLGEIETPTVMPEADLEAALVSIEMQEATQAAYAEHDTDADDASDADKPKTDELGAASDATPSKPKKEKARHGAPLSKSQKVSAKLGEKASEFLLLEVNDASLDEEALKLRQEEVLAEIDGMAKKVAEKATMLFGWLKSGGKLNEVMLRTFSVLLKEGELTGGNKGNLQTDLLAKPYSPGTAASQANQMFMLLPALKITKREKGRMIANPESLILAKAKAELGL